MGTTSILIMTVMMTSVGFALGNLRQRRDAWCMGFQVAGASTACTSAFRNGSMCSFRCGEGFEMEGPATVYCYSGKWYDHTKVEQMGIINSSLYDYDSRCSQAGRRVRTDNDVVARLLGGRVQTCAASQQPCAQSYVGMSKSACERQSCCWNAVASRCYEHMCTMAFPGISQVGCTLLECEYDSRTHHCYQAPNHPVGGRFLELVPQPEFQRPKCSLLINMDPRVRITCTDGRNIGSKCTISCQDQLWSFNGDSTVHCHLNRTWSDNGRHRTGFCKDGRRTLGSAVETCTAKLCDSYYYGMSETACGLTGCCWDGSTSTCRAKICPQTFAGMPEVKCVARGCAYDHDTGSCYLAVRCPSLPMQRSMRMRTSSDSGVELECSNGQKLGSTCNYTCPAGTLYTKSPSTTCKVTGQWDNAETPGVCQANCNFKVDLKDGTSSTHPQLPSDHARLAIDIRGGYEFEGQCNKKSIIEINLSSAKSVTLTMQYPDTAFMGHVGMWNDKGQRIAFAYNDRLYVGSDYHSWHRPGLFRPGHEVVFTFRPGSSVVQYQVRPIGTASASYGGLITMSTLMGSAKLYVATNMISEHQMVLLRYLYGNGLCSVCVRYEV